MAGNAAHIVDLEWGVDPAQPAGNVEVGGGHNVETNTNQAQERRAGGLLEGSRQRQRRRRSSSPPSISGRPPAPELDLENTFAKRVQAFYRTKVMDIDDDAITINLATFQRVRILRLQQELVLAAYKYRFTKRSSPVTTDDIDVADADDDDGAASVDSFASTSTSSENGESAEADLHPEESDTESDDSIVTEPNIQQPRGTGGEEERPDPENQTPATGHDGAAVHNDQPPVEGETLVAEGHIDQSMDEPEEEKVPAVQNETTTGQDNGPLSESEDPPSEPEDPREHWELVWEPEDEYQRLVRKYTEAIRDWEFMKECHSKGPKLDPFVLSTRRMPDYELIKSCADHFAEYVDTLPPKAAFDDYDAEKVFPVNLLTWQDINLTGDGRGRQLKQREWQQFLERVIMAFTGGAFLIGPMLIMVLVNTLVASLVVTSVCVLAFGLAMSLMVEKKFDVMSGTAAYAAVLVVFVGTSTASG